MEGTVTEERLDRMLAKAKELEATLLRCENYIESADADEPTSGILQQSKPQIVFACTVNEIGNILKSPADMFNPEFLDQLREALPMIFNKPVES